MFYVGGKKKIVHNNKYEHWKFEAQNNIPEDFKLSGKKTEKLTILEVFHCRNFLSNFNDRAKTKVQ